MPTRGMRPSRQDVHVTRLCCRPDAVDGIGGVFDVKGAAGPYEVIQDEPQVLCSCRGMEAAGMCVSSPWAVCRWAPSIRDESALLLHGPVPVNVQPVVPSFRSCWTYLLGDGPHRRFDGTAGGVMPFVQQPLQIISVSEGNSWTVPQWFLKHLPDPDWATLLDV